MSPSQESFMFTVGKLDAGMAILLGERAHLIEFPSLLLPPGVTTGSIVNISVKQNITEEKKRESDFWSLQRDILETYGTKSPEPPKLELRNVTQTSVTLEWPQLELATAKIRSLDIYRNRQRLAPIPSPMTSRSTKLSGLQLDTDYTFQLVLRTTAGVFPSNILRVHTHTINNTSGICVCFGNVQDAGLLESAKQALKEMNAKWSDKIQIDTTHFVCTTPAATPNGAQASGSISTAPGVEYQKALQLSIPVVQPHWILACHSEKKMVPIHPYYLGANPTIPPHSTRHQSMSQANLPSRASDSTSPSQQKRAANRQSMPPPSATSSTAPAISTPVASPPPTSPRQNSGMPPAKKSPEAARFEPTPEEQEQEEDDDDADHPGRTRKGTMSKNFRFPSPNPNEPPPPPVPPMPTASGSNADEAGMESVDVIAPSSVEVPPPPPVEKEVMSASKEDFSDNDEDVGETVEISLM